MRVQLDTLTLGPAELEVIAYSCGGKRPTRQDVRDWANATLTAELELYAAPEPPPSES